MKIVALDPGITTGYAQGTITDDGEMIVSTGQNRFSHIDLWRFLHEVTPDVIVCETFEFRRNQRDNLILYSRELIGIANLYCQMEECKIHMQSPAQGKGFYDDRKLQSAGIYKQVNPHANDAARHLLYWFGFGPGFKYNKKGVRSGS